jgi:RNA polymerase-binding protein DksA
VGFYRLDTVRTGKVKIQVAQKRKKTVKKKTQKKKASKNTPANKKATKKKKKARRLTAAEREHFKEMLLEKRREIFQNMFEIEGEALKKSRLDATGDLSSMPIHMADLGTDNYEQEFALGLMDGERKLLTEIDRALLRIEEGTYGICEGTGEPIPKARLEAQPWARYCVEYARMLEEGLVEEEN